MSNFSLGRAHNYAPGDEVPSLFNWVYATVAGDLGLVSKINSVEGVPVRIQTTLGTHTTPAIIDLSGHFHAGSDVNILVTNTTPQGFFAPLAIPESINARELAIQWAALIRGIDDVTAQPNGEQVHVFGNLDGFLVKISDLSFNLVPEPPVILSVPAGVWVPVGNTLSLDVGSTTATGLMVV